jgi:hypothetical protein
MSKIKRPSPPEHIVVVDTNLLWHEDKAHVVHPDFDAFWERHSQKFPMKLLIPEAVMGELLFQQTTSALKKLDRVNQEIAEISKITSCSHSHRITTERLKQQVKDRFSAWLEEKDAEIEVTPIAGINWTALIEASIWRQLPFTLDAKNPRNEKGFRDALILETVVGICSHYSPEVRIAFLCEDFALRTAADTRLKGATNFSSYESLKDFESFIELTQKNLTDTFVKSILSRAREKFYSAENPHCLLEQGDTFKTLRQTYASKIESPPEDSGFLGLLSPTAAVKWELVGEEQVWITRPRFDHLEETNIYYWVSSVRFVRLHQRKRTLAAALYGAEERRLLVLTVDVTWKANVRSDGRFFDCAIVDSKEAGFSFKEPTPDEAERYGIQKKMDESTERGPSHVEQGLSHAEAATKEDAPSP